MDRFGFLPAICFIVMKVGMSVLSAVLLQQVLQGKESFLIQTCQFKMMALPVMLLQFPIKQFVSGFQQQAWADYYTQHPEPQAETLAGVFGFAPMLFVIAMCAKNFCINLVVKHIDALVKVFVEMSAMLVIFTFAMMHNKYTWDEKTIAGFITVFAIIFAGAAYTLNKQAESARMKTV